MEFFFLDVVDAGVSRTVDLTLVVVLALTILAEAIVMLLMKYNSFGKSLLHSLVLNIASAAIGYLLVETLPALFGNYDIPHLLLLMLITIVVECPLLYLLNRKKPVRETILAASLINIVTYILFYGYIRITQ